MALRDVIRAAERRNISPLEIFNVKSWNLGVTTSSQDGRNPLAGLREAVNCELTSDNMVTQRSNCIGEPLFSEGGQHSNRVAFSEENFNDTVVKSLARPLPFSFRDKATGRSESHIITAFRLTSGDNVIAYWNREKFPGGSWVQIAKFSGEPDLEYAFSLGDKYIVVTKDVSSIINRYKTNNSIGFIDITKDTLQYITPNQVKTPTQPLQSSYDRDNVVIDPNDLTTTIRYRYAYSIQMPFGETAISPETVVAVDRLRPNWKAEDASVDLRLPNIVLTNLTTGLNNPPTINLYGGLVAQDETMYLLKEGLDLGTREYTDDGTIRFDIRKRAPEENSTFYPHCKYSSSLNGRIALWGDVGGFSVDGTPNDALPNRLYYGGTRELDVLNFAGRNITVGDSADEEIVSLVPSYSTDRKDGFLAHTAQGDASAGKEYFLTEVNETLADGTVISSFGRNPTGNAGTVGPYAVVTHLNSSYRPSKDGFLVYGERPRLQGAVKADYIDQTIREDSLGLPYTHMARCNGVVYNQKIYWSIPNIDGNFKELWVLDLTQGEGAWMTRLEVDSDWLVASADRDGRKDLLIFKGNEIFKYTREGLENFDWKLVLADIYNPISEINRTAFVHCYVTLYNLKGKVRVTITGSTTTSDNRETLIDKILTAPTQAPGQPVRSYNPVKGREPNNPLQYRRTVVRLAMNRVCNYITVSLRNASPDARCFLGDIGFTYKTAGTSDRESVADIQDA